LVQAVHLPRDELQRRFALSSRLTARVGALMAKGLGFSESVLELAGADEDMAKIVLSPRIFEQAHGLTTTKLERLAEALGLGEFLATNRLCVLKRGAARILALKDEVDAQTVWEKSSPGASETPLAVIAEVNPPVGAAVGELITDEEVDAVKLTILTSAEPKRKIEAIRKLAYASLPPDEKGRLLISALADNSTEVRVEATRALGGLGLDSDLALQIRELFQGEEAEKRIAARTLGRFAKHGIFLERAVTFVVVSKALGEESFKNARPELLAALGELYDVIVADEGFITEATGQLVAVIADSDQFGRRLARDVLTKLAQASPQKVGVTLWKRLRDIDEPRVRAALLFAIGASIPEDVDAGEFARLAIGESLRFSELDAECWQLRVMAARLGEVSVVPTVQMISASPPEARVSILRLIDLLCRESDLSDRALRLMGEAVANLLVTGSDAERVALLGLACLTEGRFPAQVRRKIATELLGALDSALMGKTLDQVEEALVSLGPVALGPIIDYVKRKRESAGHSRALRALGEIVSAMLSASDPEQKLVHDAAAFCLRLIKSGPPNGIAMIVLGQLCSRGFIESHMLQSAAGLLHDCLRQSEFPFQALDGLGWLASNPTVSLETRIGIANSLLGLFESELPEELVRERQTEEGMVLHVGPEAKAYNEMLPAAIKGLERICSAADDDRALKQRIIESFLQKWERLQKWEEVWGPANVATLADALGEIASLPSLSTADRVRIARALAGSLGRLSVIRALAKLFLLDSDSVELGSVARRVAESLLGKRLIEKGLAPEEREAILKILGVIASRRILGQRTRSLARLRARVVSALEDALREHLSVAHEWLAKLEQSEALSEFQRKEIARRLSRFERVVPR